jgi:putative hydrolases of HD superfamily
MKNETYKYLYEIGQLKRVRRSGWWIAGIQYPESVAEHSFRAAVIGFILASIEGADPYRTMAISLFHDVHEARLNDHHKVGQRYINLKSVEPMAAADQRGRLPEKVASSLEDIFQAYHQNGSLEAQLAHDADLLECLVQAREYQSQGFPDVQEWIDSCLAGLKSETAKQIAQDCLAYDPSTWWQDLKKKV